MSISENNLMSMLWDAAAGLSQKEKLGALQQNSDGHLALSKSMFCCAASS
ncbi:MAG: hypothetical protein ACRCXC_10340 [Legionella sp.]